MKVGSGWKLKGKLHHIESGIKVLEDWIQKYGGILAPRDMEESLRQEKEAKTRTAKDIGMRAKVCKELVKQELQRI
jgi:hypothetical protein